MYHNKTSVHYSFFIGGLKKKSLSEVRGQRVSSFSQGAAECLSEGARHICPSRGVYQVIEGVNKEDLIAALSAGVSCLIIIAPYYT